MSKPGRQIDPETRRAFEGIGFWGAVCLVVWALFFIGLYLVTP